MTLDEILLNAPLQLVAITEDDAKFRPDPARWSRKEILGHLIDSAVNNHQRFVRAQLAPHVDLPGYQAGIVVRSQGYQDAHWSDLIVLWMQLNRHLAHVIARVPAAALEHTVSIEGRPPVTLSFLIEDYVRHLEHHLGQIV